MANWSSDLFPMFPVVPGFLINPLENAKFREGNQITRNN